MATELRKLVEATASYMRFEQLCRRTELFSESYLAHPIGQFLLARYGSSTRAEWRHPVLAEGRTGPGRRPSIDFAVLAEDRETPTLAIESKWVGDTPDLLEQVIRDFVRLELLVSRFNAKGYFVLGGTRRRVKALFMKAAARPHPKQLNSRSLLPFESGEQAWLRLKNPSRFRQALIGRALMPFREVNVEIAASVQVSACGLFPRDAPLNQCCVVGWTVERSSAVRFQPGSDATRAV